MSKQVNNYKGKRFARKHSRFNRVATEQLHALRVIKKQGDLNEGARDMTSGWNQHRHELPERRSDHEVMRWRVKRGDRAALRWLEEQGR